VNINFNTNKNLIPAAIIIVGVLVTGVYIYVNYFSAGTLSSQAAAEKTIAFINENIEEGAVASLVQVIEEKDFYKVSLTVTFNGVETPYESYITKDGKFLFPSGINLEQTPEVTTEASGEQTSTETTTVSASFAQCLTEKGTRFYGAWWCAHCQNQKTLFGDALQYVNYIECEKTPGTSQWDLTDTCKDAEIASFPTWDFAGGTRKTGELTSVQLSEFSGCPLQ